MDIAKENVYANIKTMRNEYRYPKKPNVWKVPLDPSPGSSAG